jgi:spermidine synthase
MPNGTDHGSRQRVPHSIETSDEAGVRFLHFGSECVQGAMRIARPWALELEYTREMMLALALRYDPLWPRRVLQVGLGAASLTKFLYRHRPACEQTIIEINPAVVPVATHMFKLPQDPARIEIVAADGVAWMHDAAQSRTRYDLILVDGYDQNARFGALGSEAFYRDCRDCLGKRGVLALNLFGRSRGYAKQLDNLARAFDARTLPLEANDEGNAVAFAFSGERVNLDLTRVAEACEALTSETGIRWGASSPRLTRAIVNVMGTAQAASKADARKAKR